MFKTNSRVAAGKSTVTQGVSAIFTEVMVHEPSYQYETRSAAEGRHLGDSMRGWIEDETGEHEGCRRSELKYFA